MKQAIVYQFLNTDTIVMGARKKQTSSTFLFVHHGAALIRLGKEEIPVFKGQSFWLPIETLSAVTVLEGSHVSTFHFSVRTKVSLPKCAGFVAPHALILGVIESIGCKEKEDWEGSYGRLLRCLRDHLSFIHPVYPFDIQLRALILEIERVKQGHGFTKEGAILFNSYGINEEDFTEQMMVRNWIQKRKSGQSVEKIAASVCLSEAEIVEKMEKIGGFI